MSLAVSLVHVLGKGRLRVLNRIASYGSGRPLSASLCFQDQWVGLHAGEQCIFSTLPGTDQATIRVDAFDPPKVWCGHKNLLLLLINNE